MAQSSDRQSAALLAIKPRFAEAIIAGSKTVEFRKVRFTQPPRYVVLYASDPVKKVVAYFEVAYIKELTPLGLWRKFSHVGGIGRDEFFRYYGNRTHGFAIVVAAVWKLRTPTRLGHLFPRASVPQSFRYLKINVIQRLSHCHFGSSHDCDVSLKKRDFGPLDFSTVLNAARRGTRSQKFFLPAGVALGVRSERVKQGQSVNPG